MFGGNSLLLVTPFLSDLHPHAASLPGHAAAKGRDPPVPGDHAPAREKDHHRQQSGRRILHPQARLLLSVPQAQQVKPDPLSDPGQTGGLSVSACDCLRFGLHTCVHV